MHAYPNGEFWRRILAAAVLAVGLCAPLQAQLLPDPVAPPPPAGRQAPAPPRPVPTSELLVFLEPGADPQAFAREHGVQIRYRLKSDPNAYVVRAASPERAAMTRARMPGDRRLRAAFPNEVVRMVRHSFTPNDPYFRRDNPAPGWPGQWHLFNEHSPGLDARVMGAWNRGITGQGVGIGIIDDGVETTHPDLAPNYSAADSWDFGNNDPVPDPVGPGYFEPHGTAVAGIAAARGGNGIGVTGAAPHARLAGLRVDFAWQTVAMFVDATLYRSSGANRSIQVKNHSYGTGMDYEPASAMTTSLATSTAAGTIHCFSAGNGRDGGELCQDSGRLEPQNSPDAITVAALGSGGQFSTYSNYGANIFVTAPSSSFRVSPAIEKKITTTDRQGDKGYNWTWDNFPDTNYTSGFGGTSAASPLVAGVMALGKQVQPNLNTRLAKHLLARSSLIVDPNDSTPAGDGDGQTPGSAWKTNAAGFKFNQNYGFGLVNADGFTRLAAQYTGVTPLQVANTGLIGVNAAIPDNNLTGLRRTFTINSTTPMEEMLLTLNVTHPARGNLMAFLTSPRGTRARVTWNYDPYWDAYGREKNVNWTFCVNTFWGENPQGTWALEVIDVRAGDTGTLDSFAATARMGRPVTGTSTNASSVTVANASGALGQTVALSATLRRTSDNAALYGGTLTFKVNGAVVGSAVTNNSGVATRSYIIPQALGTGNKPITVEFAGTDLYGASSGTGTLTVTQADTNASSVTVANASGALGQTVALSATLRRTSDNAALYGGTLTFKVNGAVVGSAVTNNSGVATRNFKITDALGLGNKPITVEFAGTDLYAASTGTGTLTVTRADTNILVPTVTGLHGQRVTLRGTLRRSTDGIPLYGGTLTFRVDGGLVGTAVTDNSGVASLSYTVPAGMALGAHPVRVTFGGTARHNASTGWGNLQVKAATRLAAASVRGPRGSTVALTATLRRASDGTPVGGKTVTFRVDGLAVGNAVTGSTGVARRWYTIPATMPVGAHPLAASFAGDGYYNASSGTATLTAD